MESSEVNEFNILGCKVRLNPSLQDDEEGSEVEPERVVALVQEYAETIKEQSPNISDAQIAVLVALRLANEKLGLEQDYRFNIEKLQSGAADALGLIEEVVPTTY